MPSSFTRNRTSRKPHLLNAGGHAAELRDLRNDLYSEITGDIWASQANWVVDPVNGNDGYLGTAQQPIKTVAELNLRFDRLRLKVVPTITFVGDCIDAPFLFNGVLPVSLTGTGIVLNGTVTTEKGGTITGVSGLGAGGNTYPYQITTTGITWTSGDIGKRVSIPSGHVSWVQEFVDANNVICGQFINASANTTTPGNVAITVDALSKICVPGIGSLANGFQLSNIFSNFDFDLTFTTQLINNGSNMQLFGCRFTKNTSQFINNGPMTVRGCGFPGAASHTFRGSAVATLQSCTFISGTFATGPTQLTLNQCSFTNCPVTLTCPLFSQINIMRVRNTANPLTVQNGGMVLNNTNSTIHGATGNSGVGIRVLTGSQFQWAGAGAKPTLTGASDIQVGVTGYTYAQLGTGVVDLTTASPPVITGSPAAMFQV